MPWLEMRVFDMEERRGGRLFVLQNILKSAKSSFSVQYLMRQVHSEFIIQRKPPLPKGLVQKSPFLKLRGGSTARKQQLCLERLSAPKARHKPKD
jgi:hypothetical protein